MSVEATASAFSKARQKSKELYELGRNFTTEGVHQVNRALVPHPIYMARGEGAYIYDEDGNRYIDYVMGSGPLILGHRHPQVVEAVEAQMAKSQLYGAANRNEITLAQQIHENVPGAEIVRFVPTGSDGTALAVKLARAYTGRDLIVKFEGSFHGHHDPFLPGMSKAATKDGQYLGTIKANTDATLVIPFNDPVALQELFATRGEEIAGIILEPALRGVVPPLEGYLEQLKAICHKHGALVIFDEVVTGFRFGSGGGQAYFKVTPDLTVLGKIIGGGFPIGAVAGSQDILHLVSPTNKEGRVFFSSTWIAHTVSVAAGLATLGVLTEPGQYERLFSLGKYYRKRFNAMLADLDLRMQAIGIGPLNKVMFTDRPIKQWQDSRPVYPLAARQELKLRLLTLGAFTLGPGSYLPGLGKYLTLAHTEEDINETADIYRQALIDVNFPKLEAAG